MTEAERRRQERIRRTAARKQQQKRRAMGCLTLAVVLVVTGAIWAVWQILDLPLPDLSGGMESNPYGSDDFIRVNGYLTCTAGPTRMGIDVSEHQGEIDWAQVYEAGFDFAFIRIGYRGYTVGEIKQDSAAPENLKNAREAGFDIGAYFYAQAVTPEEAREEARWCIEYLKDTDLDLPLVYDWEYVGPEARTGSMNREEVTACFQAFCETVEAAGYRAMIYFNPHVATDLLDLQSLQDYPWWLAHYQDRMDFPHRVDFWQYTEDGVIPGIRENVDINLMFLD